MIWPLDPVQGRHVRNVDQQYPRISGMIGLFVGDRFKLNTRSGGSYFEVDFNLTINYIVFDFLKLD